MAHVTSVDWEILRGSELSAFAASKDAQNVSQAFIKHLAKHGTHSDLFSYINQQINPVEECFAVHKLFPQAAQAWLIQQLSQTHSPQKTAYLHYHITQNVILENLPRKMLEHIDFTKMVDIQHKMLFFRLANNGFQSTIENNWSVFEKVCENNPKNCYLYALSYGVDLSKHLPWSPQTPHECDQYFVACCKGGFYQRTTSMQIENLKMVVEAFAGVLESHPKNACDTLGYLFDTYPTAPWHSQLLPDLINVSLPLSRNLMEYLKQHDPRRLREIALDNMEKAIERKNTQIVKLFLPHIKPRDRTDMLVLASATGHRSVLRVLLASFKPQQLPQALHWIAPAHKNVVEDVINKMQSEFIEQHLPNSVTKPATKRKM